MTCPCQHEVRCETLGQKLEDQVFWYVHKLFKILLVQKKGKIRFPTSYHEKQKMDRPSHSQTRGFFDFYKKIIAKVQKNEWKNKGTKIYIAMCNQKRTLSVTVYLKNT